MSAFTRPDLEIRLIGPAATVEIWLAAVEYCLRAAVTRQTYRISTHPGRHTGEVRTYVTVRRRP